MGKGLMYYVCQDGFDLLWGSLKNAPVLSDPPGQKVGIAFWGQHTSDGISFSPDERCAPVHVSPKGWKVLVEEHIGSGQHEGKYLVLSNLG